MEGDCHKHELVGQHHWAPLDWCGEDWAPGSPDMGKAKPAFGGGDLGGSASKRPSALLSGMVGEMEAEIVLRCFYVGTLQIVLWQGIRIEVSKGRHDRKQPLQR